MSFHSHKDSNKAKKAAVNYLGFFVTDRSVNSQGIATPKRTVKVMSGFFSSI